ncbi:MAG TPA: AMP-binding protein [Gammaproteobacteria bacterium]|nr:AMP-binding protein [Gammaproteobacteria bacterium]
MEKIWLAHYPPGVPAEIDPGEYPSLKAIIEQSCERYADLPAYTNFGKSLSYRDLLKLSGHFGAYLQKVVALDKGDRVAIMLPNLLQYPVAAFGALRAGMVVVNCNPLYTARELEEQLVDSGARAIVILENFAHTLEHVLAKTAIRSVIVTAVGDVLDLPKRPLVNFVVRRVKKQVPRFNLPDAVRFRRAINEGKWQSLDDVSLGHDDIAFLQYTGGTTGVAKGAILSHRNMVANVLQASAWFSERKGEGGDVVITALPLYHIFSLTANCLTFLKLGGNNVLITNPRDLPALLAELARHPFTFFSGVNTLFNGLLNTPGFDKLDFSTLRITLGGGMAVQRPVAVRWQRVTGCVLSQGYGLTETSPAACVSPLNLDSFTGSVGLPVPSTDVAIFDDAGNELPIGDVGEICIRGPQVMEGYWNRPEETATVMMAGGWFRSGDIGYMDPKGFVYIEDRKKDMINVSGFNVYPNEIEAVAASHPGVLEAAAIAIADERSGEAVKLFVVRKDPALTEADLIEHCRRDLTGYKVPKEVEFRTELPKTNVGKILRRALRES